MRRTWNSWTYYGADRESGRDGDEDSVCQENWKRPRTKRLPADGETLTVQGDGCEPSPPTHDRSTDSPEERQERIAQLKRAMEEGRYKVSARAVAEKLIQNMLGNYR